MVELAKEILNKTLYLIEYKNIKKEKIFTTHIEPLFHEIQSIHHNYLGIFSRAAKELRNGKLERKADLLLLLRGERDELLQIRQVSLAAATAILESTRPRDDFTAEIRKFACTIVSYFSVCRINKTALSGISSFVTMVEQKAKDDLRKDKEALLGLLARITGFLENIWLELSASYNRIKLQVVRI